MTDEIINKLVPCYTGYVTPCWLWPAAQTKRGYGNVKYKARTRYVHIVVYEALSGPVPEGKELDHLCRVKVCANPFHLEPVTHRENVLRGESLQAKNAIKEACPQGHPYTPPIHPLVIP